MGIKKREEYTKRTSPLSPNDEAVRRRIQEILVSAGVGERRVALEVLFWLPQEFVKAYEILFHRALHLGDGDDQEKAGEDEGRIKAKVPSRLRGTKRGLGMGVGGAGGRYKNEWVVKDEEALAIKNEVDRILRGVVRRAETNLVRVSQGSTPGVGELVEFGVNGEGRESKKRCRDCGKIAKGDWARCPYPHD